MLTSGGLSSCWSKTTVNFCCLISSYLDIISISEYMDLLAKLTSLLDGTDENSKNDGVCWSFSTISLPNNSFKLIIPIMLVFTTDDESLSFIIGMCQKAPVYIACIATFLAVSKVAVIGFYLYLYFCLYYEF